MAAVKGLQVVTANRLRDGAVVFQTADGGWSEAIADALLADGTAAAQAALTAAEEAARQAVVVAPYLIEVTRLGERIEPLRYREQIRAFGPSTLGEGGQQQRGAHVRL